MPWIACVSLHSSSGRVHGFQQPHDGGLSGQSVGGRAHECTAPITGLWVRMQI